MKKRLAALFCATLAASMILAGCQASKGLETDNLKITQYKGVEVSAVDKPEKVTDDDVEQYIQSQLTSSATTTEVTDRAAQKGDTVNIDYVGTMDGQEFDGGSAQGVSLELGSGRIIEGFEDSIVGHNVGETFVWDGKFPDDYQSTDLAGKACGCSCSARKRSCWA